MDSVYTPKMIEARIGLGFGIAMAAYALGNFNPEQRLTISLTVCAIGVWTTVLMEASILNTLVAYQATRTFANLLRDAFGIGKIY